MQVETENLLKRIEVQRTRNIIITTIVGSIILAFYVLINISLQDYTVAIYETFCIFIFIYCLHLFLKNGYYDLPANLTVAVIATLAIHNFNTGGFDSTGLFWVFVLTSIIFYLKGKDAWRWVLLIHISIAIISLMYIMGIKKLPYDIFTIGTFYLALATISIFTYFYNATIDISLDSLKHKTYELEDTKLELSLEGTKIESFARVIEQREKELKDYHGSLVRREERLKDLQRQLEELKNEDL